MHKDSSFFLEMMTHDEQTRSHTRTAMKFSPVHRSICRAIIFESVPDLCQKRKLAVDDLTLQPLYLSSIGVMLLFCKVLSSLFDGHGHKGRILSKPFWAKVNGNTFVDFVCQFKIILC